MPFAKIFGLFSVVAIALFQLPAPAAETEAARPAPAATAASPALWRVAGEAGDTVIFGSIHLLRPGVEWLDGAVAKAAYGAETLTLEIHKTPEVAARIQALTMAEGTFQGARGLDQAVSPELYTSAAAVAQGLGVPEQRFRQFKPWSASLVIGVGTVLKLGFNPALGVEETLTRRLSQRGIPIHSLETADEVIGALARHPMDIQAEMLEQAVADYEQAAQLLDDLTAAWANGDVASLDRLLHSNMKTIPAFHEAVIVQRNRNWLPQIKELIATPGQHMLVVGVGHLVGADSIIRMLEADGYEVERVQ